MNELYFYGYVERRADDVLGLLKDRRKEPSGAAPHRAIEKPGRLLPSA
jgi:hypothetical protein